MFQPYAHGFFADRDDLQEAIEYANDIIQALPNEHRLAAYSALYVVINTAAKIERDQLAYEQQRQPIIGAVEATASKRIQ